MANHGYLPVALLAATAAAWGAPSYAVRLIGPAGYSSQISNVASDGTAGGIARQDTGPVVPWLYHGGTTQILNLSQPGFVTSVNAAGQAIGLYADSSGGFFYDGAAMHEFANDGSFYPQYLSANGTVIGIGSSGASVWNGSSLQQVVPGIVAAVNSNGDFVGKATGSVNWQAFSYVNGVLKDWHHEFGGDDPDSPADTEVTAINDAGVLAGSRNTGCSCSGTSTGFVVVGGTVREIPLPSAGSLVDPWLSPEFLNSAGSVSGEAAVDVDTGSYLHAFLYDPSGDGSTQDLTAGVADDFYVDAMNDAGHVAGSSGTQVFLYRNGSTSYFNSSGTVYWLNDSGDAVGGSNHGPEDSFVIADGVLIQLASLNPDGSPLITLDYADAILNSGSIYGTGTGADLAPQAYLLEAVPEPGAGALGALGGAGLVAWRRRKAV